MEAREKSRDKNRGSNESDKASAEAGSHALQDDGMLSSERDISAELAIENANKDAKDILLNESAHILSDEAGLLKSNHQTCGPRPRQPDRIVVRGLLRPGRFFLNCEPTSALVGTFYL